MLPRLLELRGRSGSAILSIHPVVFPVSTVLTLQVLVLALAWPDSLEYGVDELQAWIANRAGWLYVLTVNAALAFVAYLAVSRHGTIRFGGEDAQPEFSTAAWFAMLFSAGMGIGLLFYGVAEPMYHLVKPPHGAEPYSVAAYRDAMATTYLHWGLHPWGIYALMGAALAFYAFNQRQPLSVRSLFQPILGARINGWPGDLIDVLATMATLFGVATSLGLGAFQVNAGLAHLAGWPQNEAVQIFLIAAITAVATTSVVLGLDRGIRRLSVLNMLAAAALLIFVITAGPTQFIVDGFVQNLGQYLNDFFFLSFWTETYTGGHWLDGWTVFYWGWWIAWSPFVGSFLARISYGRTLREFIVAVVLAASGMTFIWLSAFGGSALYLELHGIAALADSVQADPARSLYRFLEALPQVNEGLALPAWTAAAAGVLGMFVMIGFFVTSSDSGSLVIDIITAGGRHDPPVLQRIFWAILEGIIAAVLLVAGGLTALQTAAISAGLPFALLLLFLIPGFLRALRNASADPGPGPGQIWSG
jgi:choline/glycine/proline betaine transport protein